MLRIIPYLKATQIIDQYFGYSQDILQKIEYNLILGIFGLKNSN